MKPETLFDKIWNNHIVHEEDGKPTLLYIDLHLVHEVTSPQAFEGLRQAGRKVRKTNKTFATMDHNVPTLDRNNIKDPISAQQIETLENNCKEFQIELFDLASPYQGIVHVIGPEQGLTKPGSTIVCGDSHTSTHGAFGALAFGIGTSEVEHVLSTQCLWQNKPKTFEVRVDGIRPKELKILIKHCNPNEQIRPLIAIILYGSSSCRTFNKLLIIIDRIIKIMIKQKINPNSSPATAKIKSVFASGIFSFKIPCPGPLPNNPPFIKALILKSIWYVSVPPRPPRNEFILDCT